MVDYYIINEYILHQIYNYNSTQNTYTNYTNYTNYTVPYLTTRTNTQCIKNIRRYYELNKKENNIYTLMIDNKDVTKLFQKYRSSISIPGNLTAHALYIYYCSKSSVSVSVSVSAPNKPINIYSREAIEKSTITCIDYNLNEKIFNYNDIIDFD
jgi:hypothetical protein